MQNNQPAGDCILRCTYRLFCLSTVYLYNVYILRKFFQIRVTNSTTVAKIPNRYPRNAGFDTKKMTENSQKREKLLLFDEGYLSIFHNNSICPASCRFFEFESGQTIRFNAKIIITLATFFHYL